MFLYLSYVCFYIVVQYNNSNVQIFTLCPVYTVQKYPGCNSSLDFLGPSLLVRCTYFRDLNVCTLMQMGPRTHVLIITRCPDFGIRD